MRLASGWAQLINHKLVNPHRIAIRHHPSQLKSYLYFDQPSGGGPHSNDDGQNFSKLTCKYVLKFTSLALSIGNERILRFTSSGYNCFSRTIEYHVRK